MKWMNTGYLCLCALLIAATVHAQTAIPTSHLAWDILAPDAATAESYLYRYYLDGAVTGAVFMGVTCATSARFGALPNTQECQVAFPAVTPGTHTLEVSAANEAGESTKSAPFTFTMKVLPGIPSNVRIQ